MNKHQEFSDCDRRANYIASILLKFQKVYEEEEVRLIKESSDSIPPYYETLEIKASLYKIDDICEYTSEFLRCSNRLDVKKQKSYGKVFETSVSDTISLKGLHKNKAIRRALSASHFCNRKKLVEN